MFSFFKSKLEGINFKKAKSAQGVLMVFKEIRGLTTSNKLDSHKIRRNGEVSKVGCTRVQRAVYNVRGAAPRMPLVTIVA